MAASFSYAAGLSEYSPKPSDYLRSDIRNKYVEENTKHLNIRLLPIQHNAGQQILTNTQIKGPASEIVLPSDWVLFYDRLCVKHLLLQ